MGATLDGIGLRRLIGLFCSFVVALAAMSTPALPEEAAKTVSVIVQGISGPADAGDAVRSVGGRVEKTLPIVGGVSAEVPERSLPALERDPQVLQVTRNGKVGFEADDFTMTRARIGRITRSSSLWDEGITGRGVTVALIDTGVYAQHPDLAGRVIHCEDFSAEADTEAHCADTFGHGTFMAGLIAGNGASSSGKFVGSAPEANIVSLKMAGFDGSTDVANILAGIQWVVAHRSTYGIEVLNLSLGSDSTQTHLLSPLNYAVQKAWKSGITVVVSAGNSGPNSRTILKPADDPYVITVGSSNDEGTFAIGDDRVPVFSSKGPTRSDGIAKPDVVAPGVHTVSLRSPGSAIDQQFGATATVATDYFRGTGTSMSAATVSGAVAQMLQAKPTLTPDHVKHRLMSTARRIADTNQYAAGKGLVDVYAATKSTSTQKANQYLLAGLSTGLGTLDGARGSVRVDVTTPAGSGSLDGELTSVFDGSLLSLKNVLGLVPYSGALYTTTGWDATTWKATTWKDADWAATTWKATTWKATTWKATTWKGTEWENADWDATTWKNVNWDATTWKATTWKSAWYAVAWE